MKNTFRKSSLISSVALLLVAIVALSGATFAWFSNNTTAQAGKIEMTATSGAGLYIVDDTNLSSLEAPASGWSSKIAWTDKVDGMVAVTGDASSTTSFFTTSTDMADGTYNGADITVATANEDFIVKKIWVKTDEEGTKTLTIKPTVAAATGYEMKGYERIAIVTADGTKIMGNAIETYDVFTNQEAAKKSVTTEAYSEVTLTADFSEPQAIYVYCWFEGQDAQCFNKNGNSNFTVELGFSI